MARRRRASGPFCFDGQGSVSAPRVSVLTGKGFDQVVADFDALVEILDRDSFVFAVRASVVYIKKHARDAVSWDSGDAQKAPVSGAGGHGRNHRQARPE